MSQQGEVFCFLSSLGSLTGYEAKPPSMPASPPPTGRGPFLTIVSLTGMGAGAMALGGNIRKTICGWGLGYQGPEGTRSPRGQCVELGRESNAWGGAGSQAWVGPVQRVAGRARGR